LWNLEIKNPPLEFYIYVTMLTGRFPRHKLDNWPSSKRDELMARWPRNRWTTGFTYGAIFALFPLLCLLAYAWVMKLWIF
jgi:hypothetical protein